jgi:hypothetical protein
MMKALYLLLLVSSTALADDAAILKCRALSDSASRVSCYDAIAVGATATAPATALSTPAKTPDQAFGMETVRQQIEQPKSIESTISGDFEGWRPGAQIKLANGQVWRVVDGSEQVLPRTSNPKVKIVRNMFGTMFLQVEGTNSSPKVRRVQ